MQSLYLSKCRTFIPSIPSRDTLTLVKHVLIKRKGSNNE